LGKGKKGPRPSKEASEDFVPPRHNVLRSGGGVKKKAGGYDAIAPTGRDRHGGLKERPPGSLANGEKQEREKRNTMNEEGCFWEY